MVNVMQEHNPIIGKNLIEMLMFSMYPDAKVFYREYVQNAYDAIVDATRKGILTAVKDGNISINIDSSNHTISVQDNGTGVSVNDVPRVLLNIADSHKDGVETAGQYGVGRLVGARYCKRLIFKTSAQGENKFSEVVFDTVLARKIIHDPNDHSTAVDVINRITTINVGDEDAEKHYFEVMMEGVDTAYKDLLNSAAIKEYMQDVAPIDYELVFKNILYKNNLPPDFDQLNNLIKNVRVSINDDTDIRRRYGLKIEGTGDDIDSLKFFKINDDDFGTLGWGWFAVTKMTKEIPSSDRNRGLRLRKQNIQIGDAKVLDKYFKQARGNHYFYGEIHATHENLRPDSARDGLAPTPEAIAFYDQIKECFSDLDALYQAANKIKNINRDIQAVTTLPTGEQTNEEKASAQNEVEKKLKELTKYEEKAKRDNNSALAKIVEIHKKEIEKIVDKNHISSYLQNNNDNTSFTVSPNRQNETEKQSKANISNKTGNAVDQFEPLKSMYTTDQLQLIRRVCAAFSQNSKPEERPIIEQIKKKVIKALGK